jgi:hypothetical protein
MTTTTSGGPTQENPAQRGRFESDDDHMYCPATTTTSLASKREPEVVLFSCFNTSATTTSLASNQARDGGGFFRLFQHLCHHHLPRIQPNASWRCFSTPLPPPPPASHPNASWRWFSPVVPCSNVSATATTSLASKREPEVVLFSCFNVSATTTTSLASKRELEVVFFGGSNASAITTTSLASQRELEVVFFGCFNASTSSSLASKCEPEVDLWGVSTSGVSFPRYQQRRDGVTGLLGRHVTSLPCLRPLNDNEGWPPSRGVDDRAVCGRHAALFAFLYPSGALSYT